MRVDVKRSRLLSLVVVAFVVAVGAAAAVAAVKGDDWPAHQQAVLDDAAGQLGVSPSELEKALRSAELKQLDEAVKAGTISKEDAERLKEAIESGEVPLFGPPLGGREFRGHGFRFGGPHGGFHRFGPGGPGFHGHGHLFGALDAAADYLGLTEEQLRTKLNDGKSLADIAKATDGKSVQGVEDAIVAAAKKDLDAAVEDERITQDMADEMLQKLEEHVDEIVNATFRLRWKDERRGTEPNDSTLPNWGGGPPDLGELGVGATV
jgi:hypothetical protein